MAKMAKSAAPRLKSVNGRSVARGDACGLIEANATVATSLKRRVEDAAPYPRTVGASVPLTRRGATPCLRGSCETFAYRATELFENDAEHFRASTRGLYAFVSRRRRAFVSVGAARPRRGADMKRRGARSKTSASAAFHGRGRRNADAAPTGSWFAA